MSTTVGSVCSVCGSWVPVGVYHSCGGSPTYPVGQANTDTAIALALGRIEALLEQILARLAERGTP